MPEKELRNVPITRILFHGKSAANGTGFYNFRRIRTNGKGSAYPLQISVKQPLSFTIYVALKPGVVNKEFHWTGQLVHNDKGQKITALYTGNFPVEQLNPSSMDEHQLQLRTPGQEHSGRLVGLALEETITSMGEGKPKKIDQQLKVCIQTAGGFDQAYSLPQSHKTQDVFFALLDALETGHPLGWQVTPNQHLQLITPLENIPHGKHHITQEQRNKYQEHVDNLLQETLDKRQLKRLKKDQNSMNTKGDLPDGDKPGLSATLQQPNNLCPEFTTTVHDPYGQFGMVPYVHPPTSAHTQKTRLGADALSSTTSQRHAKSNPTRESIVPLLGKSPLSQILQNLMNQQPRNRSNEKNPALTTGELQKESYLGTQGTHIKTQEKCVRNFGNTPDKNTHEAASAAAATQASRQNAQATSADAKAVPDLFPSQNTSKPLPNGQRPSNKAFLDTNTPLGDLTTDHDPFDNPGRSTTRVISPRYISPTRSPSAPPSRSDGFFSHTYGNLESKYALGSAPPSPRAPLMSSRPLFLAR